jgi:hypothetical protein
MEFVDIKNDTLWAQAERDARERLRLDREQLDAELKMIVKNRSEEVARNMIAMGCDDEMIAQVTELTVEDVERLRRGELD